MCRKIDYLSHFHTSYSTHSNIIRDCQAVMTKVVSQDNETNWKEHPTFIHLLQSYQSYRQEAKEKDSASSLAFRFPPQDAWGKGLSEGVQHWKEAGENLTTQEL